MSGSYFQLVVTRYNALAQLDPGCKPSHAGLGRHQAGPGDQSQEAAGEGRDGQPEEPGGESPEEEGGHQGGEETV